MTHEVEKIIENKHKRSSLFLSLKIGLIFILMGIDQSRMMAVEQAF